MTVTTRRTFAEIEHQLCDLVAERLGLSRPKVMPRCSLVEDLGCDSLDFIDLLMAIEAAFDVALPDDAPDPVYKAVFTRRPFRLSDLAELVYLQHGTGAPVRRGWRKALVSPP